ncbi:MAG: metallophosphoesterase family protein [Crocinitomicaceae bacterium]|nr:metallophosphoesterase family protein [Crocinitomicaceae bacterium]
MKRIGVLSDTHGHLDEKIFTYFKDVDEIWHGGDVGSAEVIEKLEKFKPVRGVYGNIDDTTVRKIWPKHNRFKCEELEILISHIAGKPYKYSQEVFEELNKKTANIFVCGHSHILLVQFDKNLNCLWLNPGACGYKGFHKVKTLLRFEIHGKEIKNMEAIEMGPRLSGNEHPGDD